MSRHRVLLPLVALVSTFAVPWSTGPAPAGATTLTATALSELSIDFDPRGSIGLLGVDVDVSTVNPFGGYPQMQRWTSDGRWLTWDRDLTSTTYGHPTGTVGGPLVEASASWARLEFYPADVDGCIGDDWQQACYWESYSVADIGHGGLHIEVRRNTDGSWPAVGRVFPPTAGDELGGFAVRGRILSPTPVAAGRVRVDAFQIGCSIYETCVAPPVNAAGTTFGAFSSGANIGEEWSMGVAWPGRYTVFVTDTATGVAVQGLLDVAPGAVPTLDLGVPCFGMRTCVALPGTPATAAPSAGFHPVSPVRILDTRKGIGLTGGPVRAGDGALDTTNAEARAAERDNHDLVVAGVAGIPTSGVSAVLLNVTAVDPTGEGYVTVGPRPAGSGDLFDDQNSYGTWPDASNINLAPGSVTPNLVLAPVGAGGIVRFRVFGASTHVLADVAGWFSHDPTLAGDDLTGVRPIRLLDTRHDTAGAFSAGDRRTLRVAGVGGVPDDATSVVVNVTAVDPAGTGYVTAFPTGTAVPDVSNVNLSRGVTRPNLSVVRVGAGGSIDLVVAETASHLLVDVFGYYSTGGGDAPTVASAPFRVFDTRNSIGTGGGSMRAGERRRVRVAGVGAAPAGASAVYANITVVSPTGEGFLTAWPAGGKVPDVSNLNFTAGEIIPNMAILGLGEDGAIDVELALPWDVDGGADVLVDVLGWVTPTS
jgi:hypothetical protein